MKKKEIFRRAGAAWILAGTIFAVWAGRRVPVWTGAVPLPEPAPSFADEQPASEPVQDEETEPEILPNVLNLVFEFPDGADSSNVLNSKMGAIYQELEITDQNWLDQIYNLSGMTPEQMAARLGRSADSIMGKYNRKDENQRAEDPSTWKVGSWSRIHISILDGDGKEAEGTSNVKEILSMANVYTFYHDYQDTDLFLEYAKELWNASHSYQVSMSDVYYCDGCMDLSEAEEMAEDVAEMEAEESSAAISDSQWETEPENGQPPPAETEAGSGSAEAGPGTAPDAGASAGTAEEPGSGGQAGAAEEPEIPESAARTESAGAETAAAFAASPTAEEAAAAESVSGSSAADTASEAYQETPAALTTPSELQGPGEYVQMLVDAASEEETQAESRQEPETEETARQSEEVSCPGHIDLTITVRVVGTEESRENLYQLDSRGAETSERWSGWNEEMKALTKDLTDQDWYENYGLSISDISLQPPMGEAEIDTYLELLPPDLSPERRELVRFALESVGRVPYYWGGKASAPGYEGNHFGSLVSSDKEGRIKKGLDCSGWIAWVYWSVTGERLPAEGTSGLIRCGSATSRSRLQPGDIIVRTGDNAHVVMFLGWGSGGKLICIHESSGPANNVTVSELDANWKYYRNLIE